KQPRQSMQCVPDQDVIIGEIGIDNFVVGGLEEGLVKGNIRVAHLVKPGQNQRQSFPNSGILLDVCISSLIEIGGQSQYGCQQLVQLEARLQYRPVDVSGVNAQIAPLPREDIV